MTKYIYNVGYYDSNKQLQETQLDLEEKGTYDSDEGIYYTTELINLILDLKKELDIEKIDYIDFVKVVDYPKHYGRIKVLVPDEDMMESLCVCPHCGSEVTYGEMCMYNGIHSCPNCIESLRKTVDFDRENQYDVYVRKGNNHEYEPYRYVEEIINTVEKQKAALCDALIDTMCETRGVRGTIDYLSGFISKEDILSLGFDKEDVEDVYEDKEDNHA